MKCKIMRTQKLLWRNIMRSTKSQKTSVLYYSIYIYIYTSRKPMRCTGKLLKIKSKLILIHFTFFVEGQGLATNQFVARLLQPTTW
jgi:hypothetical protein